MDDKDIQLHGLIPGQSKAEKIVSTLVSIAFLRAFVVIVFTLVLGYKISTIPFDLTKFDFSSLLSLILALFAIALSAAFYWKGTDQSNKFYHDSYMFTKDVSQILGRIEAGFGERLRHLDEGYTGLTRYVLRGDNETEIEKDKERVEEKEKARDKLIEELVNKAELKEKEKKEILERFRRTEAELESAKAALNKSSKAESGLVIDSGDRKINIGNELITTLKVFLDRNPIFEVMSLGKDDLLRRLITNLSNDTFLELNKLGLIDINRRFVSQELRKLLFDIAQTMKEYR